jgi:hypothetical protein
MTVLHEQQAVDWLAVEFVCNGTPMRLGDDRATLEAAVLTIGFQLTVKQIAERCGTHTCRVSRILNDHGAVQCLICRRNLLCTNGITPEHVGSNGLRCGMSGYQIGDAARAGLIRAANRKMARLG